LNSDFKSKLHALDTHLKSDPWLGRWMALVKERAADLSLLELGCGSGQDTAALAQVCNRIFAVDLSPVAIATASAAAPMAQFFCQDVRAPFPTAAGQPAVVVASLSLHYFTWAETLQLAQRIHTALAPTGLLLCRLNSTNDHHYGASGHPEIEPHYYLVDGEPKRFFDHAAVQALFNGGWRVLSMQEQTIARYAKPKVVWEIILEKDA
jgi:SAM-dependent methyltransferase